MFKENIKIKGKKELGPKKGSKVLCSIKKVKNPKAQSFTNGELKRLLDSKYLKITTVKQLKDDIKQFNKSYPGEVKGSEFSLLAKKDNNLIIGNSKGDLELLEVTKINSRSILNYIKSNDSKAVCDSYSLRNEIFHIDDSIKSFEAFTKGDIPKGKYEAKDYLKNEDNWLPERVELHKQLFDKYYNMAIDMSDRLNTTVPRVICMKGNTAVGKTYTLKHMDKALLTKYPLLDNEGEPSGSLNPDILKTAIRNYDRTGKLEIVEQRMKHTISDCQAHIEGGIINDKIIRKLFDEKKNVVLDKRFVDEKSIQKTVTSRMGEDYKLTVIDVEADYKDSLERAYNREVDSNKPIVPFEQIEDGFIKTRTNRDKIARMKEVDEYFLFYKSKLVARGFNGRLIRTDHHLYNKLVHLETMEELEKLRFQYKEKINDKVKNWK